MAHICVGVPNKVVHWEGFTDFGAKTKSFSYDGMYTVKPRGSGDRDAGFVSNRIPGQ